MWANDVSGDLDIFACYGESKDNYLDPTQARHEITASPARFRLNGSLSTAGTNTDIFSIFRRVIQRTRYLIVFCC